MLDWPVILAAGDDFSSELLYVIAVLVLAGIGAIAEKLKQKKAGQSKTPPRRPTPQRPTIPPRPQQQRQAPRPPVVWEARPPQRTARPRPSAPRPAPPAARPAQDRRVLVQPSSPPAGLRPVSPVTPVVEVIDEGARGKLVAMAVKKEDEAVARHEGVPVTGPPVPVTGARPAGLAWLGLSRADLPRAVILSEILSRPIGLREQERQF